MGKLLTAIFLFVIFLQGSFVSLPLVVPFLVITYVFSRDSVIFFLAFLAGILLDILLVRDLGFLSIFFVIMIFLITVYERKFEIESKRFIASTTFLGSVVYLLLIGAQNIVIQSFIVSSVIFLFLLLTFKRNKKSYIT